MSSKSVERHDSRHEEQTVHADAPQTRPRVRATPGDDEASGFPSFCRCGVLDEDEDDEDDELISGNGGGPKAQISAHYLHTIAIPDGLHRAACVCVYVGLYVCLRTKLCGVEPRDERRQRCRSWVAESALREGRFSVPGDCGRCL